MPTGRNLTDQIAASAPWLVSSSGSGLVAVGGTRCVECAAMVALRGCGADISTATSVALCRPTAERMDMVRTCHDARVHSTASSSCGLGAVQGGGDHGGWAWAHSVEKGSLDDDADGAR